MGFLFEPRDESARPWQGHAEIIDAEKQEEPVGGRRRFGAHQGGMLVGAPLVQAKQDSSIRVEDLPKVGMGWRRLRLAEQRLVPVEADTSRTPIIVHVRFMTPSCGLT